MIISYSKITLSSAEGAAGPRRGRGLRAGRGEDAPAGARDALLMSVGEYTLIILLLLLLLLLLVK